MSQQKVNPSLAKGCLLTAIILFGLAVACGIAVTHQTPEQQAEHVDRHNRIAAYVACKNAVQTRLKAPSSADFSSFTGSQVVLKDAFNYEVAGSVDAQNSFGAKLRSNFSCIVDASDNAESPSVHSVKIN